MSSEADEVIVQGDDFGKGRVKISVTHGMYTSSMNVTRGEASRIRDAIEVYLSDQPNGDRDA